MSIQRYVSGELTHFVGRGLSESEQYDLLVQKILKPGWLTYPPHDCSPDRSPAIDLSKTISNGQMIAHQVVCFCDIPVADFTLHMSKYSHFGIAFRKEFLIPLGANPVFYIANNSNVAVNQIIPLAHLSDRIKIAMSERKIERGLYFDTYIKVLCDLLWAFDSISNNYDPAWYESTESREETRARIINMMTVLFSLNEAEVDRMVEITTDKANFATSFKLISEFLLIGVFDFIKCYDATLPENHLENYYMEREWRVPKNISFKLNDIERVIIPRKFADAFRKDIPEYNGQLNFSI